MKKTIVTTATDEIADIFAAAEVAASPSITSDLILFGDW